MKHAIFYTLAINAITPLAFATVAPPVPIKPTISDKTEMPITQPLPAPSTVADNQSERETDSTAVNVTEQDLLDNPPLLQQALYASVLNNQVAAIAMLLPLYEQLPSEYQTGDDNEMLLTLAKASLAKENGKYGIAIELYRKAINKDPGIHAARFALAQSLYNDKRYHAAKREFEQLKATPELPQAVQGVVSQYLTAIDKKDDWKFYANAYYTQDKNVTNVPDEPVEVNSLFMGKLTYQPKQESAQGLSYQFNANKDIHLFDRLHSRTELDVYGKWYWDNHQYDDMTMRGASGISYQTAHGEFAILPYMERRIYADERYSKEVGVRGELTAELNGRNRLQASVEYGDEDYYKRVDLNGNRKQASASWLWLQNAKQYWTLSGDFTHKDANDLSNAYYRRGVRLGVVRSWGNLNTGLSVGVARKQYEAPDFWFGIQRKDTEYNASLSIWDNRIRFWGVTPRLVGTYQRVDSNNPVNEYDKSNVFVQLAKSF